MKTSPFRRITFVICIALVITAWLADATTLWQFETGGRVVGKPTLEGDTLYVAGGNTVHALSTDGNELWHRELAGAIAAGVQVEDGVVLIHSSEGLHALSDRGEAIWSYENTDLGPLVDGRTQGWGAAIVSDPWGWYRSAPLIHGDTVYFGSSDGVHAVSKKTGEATWQAPIGPVTADPVAFEDLIIAACWNNSIYGIDEETGKIRWRFRAPIPPSKGIDWVGYSGFHLTPVVEGDRIFVGTRGTYFYSINATDGTVAWSSKVGSSWIGSPAVVGSESIYYGLSDGMAVLGYLKSSGKLTLFFDTGSLVFAQPELHGENLIVGTLSGHLFSIDIATGQGTRFMHLGPEEAKYAEYFNPETTPKDLTRYEATKWSIERMLTESNSILNLLVHGDTAYIGTASGGLYAIDLGSEE